MSDSTLFSENLQNELNHFVNNFKTYVKEEIPTPDWGEKDFISFFSEIFQLLVLETLDQRKKFPEPYYSRGTKLVEPFRWVIDENLRPLLGKIGQFGQSKDIDITNIIDYCWIYILNSKIQYGNESEIETLKKLRDLKLSIFISSEDKIVKTKRILFHDLFLEIEYTEPDFNILKILMVSDKDLSKLLSKEQLERFERLGIREMYGKPLQRIRCRVEFDGVDYLLTGTIDEFSCFNLEEVGVFQVMEGNLVNLLSQYHDYIRPRLLTD